MRSFRFRSADEAAVALAPFGFDPALQARFAARAKEPATHNAVKGTLEPLPSSSIVPLPVHTTPEREALRAEGMALIKAGKVGVVVLAGGMATRFGGVVKAVVPALGERSFLELKHDDVQRLAEATGATIPIYVMSSFATHDVIEAHVAERQLSTPQVPVTVFAQKVALRLTPAGEPFVDDEGCVSPAATGHGDLVPALRDSGVMARFRAQGGTIVFMTNVDNLGATLDPALVALHARLGGAITAEVVKKLPGDAGGAPALLDGVPQIVEGFRFPPDFDQTRIDVFNTNTFYLQASEVDRDVELPYYRVEKKVDGATVIQFERLVGELTAFVPSRFVEVPRDGEDCRFIPVKEPKDLQAQHALIELVVGSTRSTRSTRSS
jgi:UTP--glucose-1-phosphate uridylyltransferase